MDELTPIEPEYREIPPEQPPQIPYYYGTGVQPPQKKSRLPLVLTLLTVLMALNLATVAISLFSDDEASEDAEVKIDLPQLINTAEGELRDETKKNELPRLELGEDLTLKEIYEHYAPSSVIVSAQSIYGLYTATGVVLTQDGYLLTDAEIAGMMGDFSVKLYDGTSCEAAFVGVDESCGMAILKIDREGLATVDLSPDVAMRTQEILENILTGMQSPATMHLDISDVPDPVRIYWGLPEGVIINRLLTNSNAYSAGLRPGDVLLRIGRIEIASVSDYWEALNLHKAGETVRVYIYRGGSTYYTDVCLDAEG